MQQDKGRKRAGRAGGGRGRTGAWPALRSQWPGRIRSLGRGFPKPVFTEEQRLGHLTAYF